MRKHYAMTDPKGFAAHLRKLRESRGISQGELARRARVERNTVWRYESGDIKQPKMDVLERMAAALDVDVADLVQATPERRPTKADREAHLERAVEELVRSRRLSEREIEILRSMRDLGEVPVDADVLWSVVVAMRARVPSE